MKQCRDCKHFDNGLLHLPVDEDKDFCWKHEVSVFEYEECTDWEEGGVEEELPDGRRVWKHP